MIVQSLQVRRVKKPEEGSCRASLTDISVSIPFVFTNRNLKLLHFSERRIISTRWPIIFAACMAPPLVPANVQVWMIVQSRGPVCHADNCMA